MICIFRKVIVFICFLILLGSCKKNHFEQPPIVEEQSPILVVNKISSIGMTIASCISNVITDSVTEIVSKGLVWNIVPHPTLKTNLGMEGNGAGAGQFSSILKNLNVATNYFIRAYAINKNAVFYSDEVILKTHNNNDMLFIKGGKFKMGGSRNYDSENPVHSVVISDFYIAKYEVTQALWKLVMGNNPSYFKGGKLPVESVSWDDVQLFISKLNKLEEKNYRLPTEAEWEYVARGGRADLTTLYSGNNFIDSVAWYRNNSLSETLVRSSSPVGLKQMNELGVYDMSGNVWEWCSDFFGLYPETEEVNPKGPRNGDYKVYRGGAWNSYYNNCRVGCRNRQFSHLKDKSIGFRLAMTIQ